MINHHTAKKISEAATKAAPAVAGAALTLAAIVIGKNEKDRKEWINEWKKKLS